jgi:hypothetical protein
MGSDYFVAKAVEIVKKIAPDAQFYPQPTEVEIVVEADPPPPQIDGQKDPDGPESHEIPDPRAPPENDS